MRQTLDGIEELAESLRGGQVLPLLVLPADAAGNHPVVDGHRRVQAATHAGLTTLDAIVLEEAPDHPFLAGLTANTARASLTPLDLALALEKAISSTGLSQSEVARTVGMTESQVSKTRSLLRLPDSVRAMVDSQIPVTVAYQLATIQDPEAQAQALDEYLREGLTRDEFQERRSKKRRRSAPPKAAHAAVPLGGGRHVRLTGPGELTLELAIEWLEELLAKARRLRGRGMNLTTAIKQLRIDATSAAKAAARPA